ncbi:TonB-dependent receptor [uncultured Paludibacter sp.]|nr:TonB-dependent receptor [uncultured Paludibacter sp.]
MKKTINIYCFVLGLLLLFPMLSFAQEKTLIRGTVIDNDGEPLIRATITERDKDNRILSSAVTDIDGNFSINVFNPNNRLSFRYVGFKEKIVVPGKERVLNVSLEDANITTTSEVTITAKAQRNLGGLAIDDRDLSMAMSKINAEELEGLHTSSIDDALQGRMSGVDIVGTTGNPGAGMSIRVRGLTSMNGNNQPLIVVDGVPIETTVGATGANFDLANATEEEFSQMLNIPPSDIQEVVVLKDAAASAIYGSRGANGVLLITTKRGSISPPKISVQSTFTLNTPRERIPTLSGYQYVTMVNEAMFNAGKVLSTTEYPEFAYDPNNPEYYYNYSNNTDWVEAITKNGFAQDYNISLTGGSRKVRYYFSSGYWDETGTTIGTGYQRLNTRANLNYTVSDKLRFQADIAYTHSNKQMNFIPEASNYTSGDLASKAYVKMPNQSIYYYNIYGEQTSLYYTPYTNVQGTYPSVYNPVAMANDSKNTITSDNVKPNFVLTYDFTNAWQFSFNVSFEIANNKTKQYLPQTATGLLWNNSSTNWALDGDDDTFTMQTFSKLRWIPKFKNDNIHRFIALLGYNTYDTRGNSYYEATSNLPSTFLQDPSISSRVYPSGSLKAGFSQRRTLSLYANANYTLLDRYIIYGSIRMDGDSRFGKNYRYGIFPAISGRYRISGEPFMKEIKWIDDLSVRASWGVNGNPPSNDYIYYGRYDNYDWYYLGNAATYPTSFSLDNLHWEVTTQKNIGLNLICFDERVNMEFEYYIKRTDDNIPDKGISIPTSSGFSSAILNSNTIENIGWELNVMTTPIRNKDWKVDLSFNVARSQNFVRELAPYSTTESGDWQYNGQYLTRTELNQPYGSFYGFLYDGVYLNKDQTIARDKDGNKIYTMGDNGELEPVYMKFGYPTIGYEFQPGDARYVDINHDGNINLQDVVYLGDYNPLFFGGFGPTIRYKNFSINSWFVYRYGNDIMNMTRMTMENMYGFNNQSTSVLKRFTHEYEVGSESEAPVDLLPRALYSKGYNWLGSSRFIEKGSFIRWKTATLRYNMPKRVVKTIGISDMNVWFTMQNIYVLTNYTGQDPEVSISGSTPGQDASRSPRPYQFTFGFKFGL